MSQKLEKNRDGIIIRDNDSPEKLDVEINQTQQTGDYEKEPVFIYRDWCKKCGICVAFCPTNCLGRNPDGSPFIEFPEKCIHCETCDRLCPDFAITGAMKR